MCVYLSIYLSIYPSIYIYICIYIFCLFIYLGMYVPMLHDKQERLQLCVPKWLGESLILGLRLHGVD